MSSPDLNSPDLLLARRIATLLRCGTIVAAVLFAAGAVLMVLHPGAATWLLTAGCAVLVALPVVRLLVMTGHFARLRLRWLVAASVAVLALVVAGALSGLLL